jgi:hypothetical protein
MKKKRQKPKTSPVTIRREEVSTRFRQALALNKPGNAGRPAIKYNEVIAAVGSELAYFVDACLDRRVTTRQLMEAVKSLGVVISYPTMVSIRKQIEHENRWFYDMLDQMDNPQENVTVL